MRHLLSFVLFVLFGHSLNGQLQGNGKIKTFTENVKGIKSINIQFNADIILDFNKEEKLIMNIDDNLKEYVGMHFSNGQLTIDQIKWINPSKMPQITIGTPLLEKVFQGTHMTTEIINIESDELKLHGNVGEILAFGKAKEVNVNTSGTIIDLENLEITQADIKFFHNGQVIVSNVEQLIVDDINDSRLRLKDDAMRLRSSEENRKAQKAIEESINPDLEFIKFTLKNNSLTRNHFYVEGPKRDGSQFSYGFPMMPNAKRPENWTVGTKVYKTNKLGMRKLLLTVKKEDEGQVLKIF